MFSRKCLEKKQRNSLFILSYNLKKSIQLGRKPQQYEIVYLSLDAHILDKIIPTPQET